MLQVSRHWARLLCHPCCRLSRRSRSSAILVTVSCAWGLGLQISSSVEQCCTGEGGRVTGMQLRL